MLVAYNKDNTDVKKGSVGSVIGFDALDASIRAHVKWCLVDQVKDGLETKVSLLDLDIVAPPTDILNCIN